MKKHSITLCGLLAALVWISPAIQAQTQNKTVEDALFGPGKRKLLPPPQRSPRVTSPGFKLSPDDAKVFSWFDRLGLPDIRYAEFVHVWTGESTMTARGRSPVIARALLLKEDGPYFNLLTLNLFEERMLTAPLRPTGRELEADKVGFKKLDIAKDSQVVLDIMRGPVKGQAAYRRGLWRGGRPASRMATLAWINARQGRDTLSKLLLREASMLASGDRSVPLDGDRMIRFLREDIAKAQWQQAIRSFSNLDQSWEELRDGLKKMRTRFPFFSRDRDVRQMIADLDRMLSTAPPAEIADIRRASADQIARSHVHNLRTLKGTPQDIFADKRGLESPAQKLVAMSYSAVPVLVDSLIDNSFTRTVSGKAGRTDYVLRVGDVSVRILYRITGHEMFRRLPSELSPEQRERFRERTQRWWEDVRSKGEFRLLSDRVIQGGPDAVHQGRLLVSRFPDRALQPLVQAVKRSGAAPVRGDFVELIGQLPEDEASGFLIKEMEVGRTYRSRALAAEQAFRRGMRRQAIAAFKKTWIQMLRAAGRPEFDERLVRLMAGCGDEEAIQMLADDWSRQSVGHRKAVVSIAGQQPIKWFNEVVVRGQGRQLRRWRELDSALEAVLIAALNDTELVLGGLSLTDAAGLTTQHEARVCDLAAYYLSTNWSERYTYKITATLAERSKQCMRMNNAWRGKHDLSPLLASTPPVRIDLPRSVGRADLSVVQLEGHKGDVVSVDLSPDGERAATASRDGTVRIWDVSTGQLIRRMVPHGGREVASVDFSPNGSEILTGGVDRLAKVFNADSGKLARTLRGHRSPIVVARYSGDGRKIITAGKMDRQVCVWVGDTEQVTKVMTQSMSVLTDASFASDDRTIICAGGFIPSRGRRRETHVLQMLNRHTGDMVWQLPATTKGRLATLAVSPTKPWVVAEDLSSSKPSIRKWNYKTGEALQTWEMPSPRCLVSSPDGRFFAAGYADGTIEIINWATGRSMTRLTGHESAVLSLAVSSDGKTLVSGSADQTARLWEIR